MEQIKEIHNHLDLLHPKLFVYLQKGNYLQEYLAKGHYNFQNYLQKCCSMENFLELLIYQPASHVYLIRYLFLFLHLLLYLFLPNFELLHLLLYFYFSEFVENFQQFFWKQVFSYFQLQYLQVIFSIDSCPGKFKRRFLSSSFLVYTDTVFNLFNSIH